MADAVVRLEILTEPATAVSAEALLPPRADVRLVERLQAGCDDAYEELIAQYQQPVYNLVYRLVWDPGDACDVVQEVFLKIFRNIGNFRAQSSLKTWIYRIAMNEANNRRRWFTRHRKHEVELDLREDDHHSGGSDWVTDHGDSPFELALSAETQDRIETALRKLSPNFRDAVILRDIEELSYEEIAEILNLNMNTVKTRILRGREALRKTLTQQEQSAGLFSGIRAIVSTSRLASGE